MMLELPSLVAVKNQFRMKSLNTLPQISEALTLY